MRLDGISKLARLARNGDIDALQILQDYVMAERAPEMMEIKDRTRVREGVLLTIRIADGGLDFLNTTELIDRPFPKDRVAIATRMQRRPGWDFTTHVLHGWMAA